MAEPMATQDTHTRGEIPEQHPPPASAAAAASVGAEARTQVGRNERLEAAVRQALDGSTKDLGRLCKTLGESFCLPSARPARAVGCYDSGSDTTAPADQEHSSSESGVGSETCGEASVSTAPTGVVGTGKGSKELEHGNVRAVAMAAGVRRVLLALASGSSLTFIRRVRAVSCLVLIRVESRALCLF